MKTTITVNIDVDLEKFRYSLVGDGKILEEVEKLTKDELEKLFIDGIYEYVYNSVDLSYMRGKQMGLY